MELNDLDFRYKVQSKKFNYILFNFKTKYFDSSKDFMKLDEILNGTYKMPRFKTKKEDEVNSYLLSSKLNYFDTWSGFSILFGKNSYTTLEKKVSTDNLGINDEVELKIFQIESNQIRLFKIYSEILGLDELQISPKAQVQIDKINYLRAGKFNENSYLSLKN